MSTLKIVTAGTSETAPVFLSEDGMVPKWCGRKDASLSRTDLEAMTEFCMEDAYQRGLEEGILQINPFHQSFLNGVPAMVYSNYMRRGELEARGWWNHPSIELFQKKENGVEHGLLPIHA